VLHRRTKRFVAAAHALTRKESNFIMAPAAELMTDSLLYDRLVSNTASNAALIKVLLHARLSP
jgi:hypothetical protein